MKKILIVDDEYLIRYSLSATFKSANAEVTTAADGESALKAINENRFDLCILDIHLPDMDGLEIMKKLGQASPLTKIIIMTGSEVSEKMMHDIQEYAHLLISKPFDLARIKAFVDQIFTIGRPVYGDTCSALNDMDSFVKWHADGVRRHKRLPVAKKIGYSVFPFHTKKTTDFLIADILDISEGGMCLRTDCRLDPGHILKLNDALVQCEGVVRWSARLGTAEAHRVGVQFVNSMNNINHFLQ
ncbi:MAG: response regulator [Nitrospirae bacterium]|nr:response regulator [Nitrospirota bacterium]NTW65171.1 response regulator [Nitrospirota bacterium]